MAFKTSLETTCIPMSGGAASSVGTGERHDITIAGTWSTGDTFSVIMTDNLSGLQTLVGYGNLTGKTPTFVFTFNEKLYVLAGDTVYFSSVGQPTVFNQLDGTGNGFVKLSNQYSTPENLVAIAAYQGRLVFFSRQTIQIWNVSADPTAWALVQVLQNVGAFAALGVRSLGDLDVFFPNDTGIRTLRAKETTLNAFVEDIGSPIDATLQSVIRTLSASTLAAGCGIVEPTTNRYWFFLNNTIYVLSYFPSAKVVAWGKYLPTYLSSGSQVAFTPQKFVIKDGRVYARDASAIYLYGGSDNNTYDNSVATVELPYLDAKSPSTRKVAKGIDVAMTGAWTLSGGMDPESGILSEIHAGTTQSFDKGKIPWSSQGTHFKLKAVTTGSTAAKLSSLIFKYELGDEE